jgi:hypothetical protein
MDKHISEKAESIEKGSRISVPLYERRKGKVFHASGSWRATNGEKLLIEAFGCMFFFGVFIGIMMLFIHPGKLALIILGIGIAGAVGSFVSLFAIVLLKHRRDPMETHYYDADYRRNAITGEETDNTRDITKEEFFGEK